MIKKITFFLIFILTLVAIGLMSANYAGICITNKTYLSDKDVISLAVSDIFQSHIASIEYEKSKKGDTTLVEYKNIEDFIARNPSCCSLTRSAKDGFEVALENRLLLGTFRSFVRIEFLQRMDPNDPAHPKRKIGYLAVKNCGDVWSGI